MLRQLSRGTAASRAKWLLTALCTLFLFSRCCSAQGTRASRNTRPNAALAGQEQLRTIRSAFGETEDQRGDLRQSALEKWKGEKTDLYYWLLVDSKYSRAFAVRKGSSRKRHETLTDFADATLDALLGTATSDNDSSGDDQETRDATSKQAVRIKGAVLAIVKSQKLPTSPASTRLYQWRRVGAQLKRVLTILGEAVAVEAQYRSGGAAENRIRDIRNRLLAAQTDFARAALDMFSEDEDDQQIRKATDQVILVLRLESLRRARDQALVNWAKVYQKMRSGSDTAFDEARARSQVFVREAAVQSVLIQLNSE